MLPDVIDPDEVPESNNQQFEFIESQGWVNVKKTPFDMANFSLTGTATKMREKMLEDKFVLWDLAIFGQCTAIYSKPSSGKTLITLKLLIDGIKSSEISGADIFYVNADDNYKGLVTKLELAEKYKFHMLAPGHCGFISSDFLSYLQRMNAEDTARGKIIILDKLKKFAELMDKRAASEFMTTARVFVSNGGTLILLAHVNKHLDPEGKPIYSGTSDIVDDVDCAYTLDVLKENPDATTKTVIFENIKSRGDVIQTVAYRYTMSTQTYIDLIDSVRMIEESEAAAAKKLDDFNRQLEKDSPIIAEIIAVLNSGIFLKTEVVKLTSQGSGFSRRAVVRVLNLYQGSNHTKHKWICTSGERGAITYAVLTGATDQEVDHYQVNLGDFE